ncbi:LysR substrate-binding domain-containing protein [Dyadobacter psychrophilus]|uniref:LysR substrate-binding domain-containing protein n=1 Tax=Dyadobacter psychrophilus TaxID=651661 RepID=UPI0009E55415|nr:LysR substrate-binding domain-containing protein [Dyadobacter psychrophilus]
MCWLSSKGIVQYKSTVLNSIEGIINFFEAGLGMTILPEEVVSQYYAGRKITSNVLDKQLGTMITVLIFRQDKSQSAALKAFIDMYSSQEKPEITAPLNEVAPVGKNGKLKLKPHF